MEGQCSGIRGFLCKAVIDDLDYLIGNGIFTDDIQAIQSALIQVATQERVKELQRFKALSK